MRILIAEDDFTSRNLLKTLLARRGHEVVSTVNGAEAWEAMQRPDAPRLAILDWMMPQIDGLDLCRRIRARKTDRPPYVIMVTTKGEKSDIIAGLEGGADDYLPKPYNPGELHARVNVGLRLIEMQDMLAGKIEELHQALDHIKTLRGIVPICSCCKKIRDDQGYWNQVEVYVREHTEVEFSHSICPECRKELYPGSAKEKAEGNP
ncbi:MAG: response regulator transcription factor [Deltaproteobacteria bacterium]|nr:response regulator transcription factor [Deltaproteobacteria bacterium]